MTVEVAKKFYKMQLQMKVISIETINVAEDNGTREHVTFDVRAHKIKEPLPIQEGPPTFIAQTKKHSERQILKEVIYNIAFNLIKITLNSNCFINISIHVLQAIILHHINIFNVSGRGSS